jgi:hypothetical protein
MACAVSGSPPKNKYRVPRPSRPSAATVSPMTEPPKKATERAAAAPCVCAAVVVRTLARVAVYMPKKPASIEHTAPVKKAIIVYRPRLQKSNAATTTTKPARIVYSRFRKTIAPRWMASPIRVTFSSPAGLLITTRWMP